MSVCRYIQHVYSVQIRQYHSQVRGAYVWHWTMRVEQRRYPMHVSRSLARRRLRGRLGERAIGGTTLDRMRDIDCRMGAARVV